MSHDTFTPSWGSNVAKEGFQNEADVADKFRDWEDDPDAQEWLKILGYNLFLVDDVMVRNLAHNSKPDLRVYVTTRNGTSTEYISIKKAKQSSNYNHADKRWVADYAEKFDFPEVVTQGLKMYTGRAGFKPEDIQEEFDIDIDSLSDRKGRRLKFDELPDEYATAIREFFSENSREMIQAAVSGFEQPYAEWMLVTEVDEDGDVVEWTLNDIESSIEKLDSGFDVTRYGNIKLGEVTVQRKGGDNGRETAQMLQFKISPLDLPVRGTAENTEGSE